MKKLLIANRGEIAVRIMKTAKRLKIKTVAIFSEADRNALHVQKADEAYFIGSNDLADSYLNIAKIISIAKKSDCDAIHPGYGFLSENSEFVAACAEGNILFIGPDSKVMELMGNKIKARNFIKSINVPLVEGITGTTEELLAQSENLQYPLLIKAAAGGGGKGMRIVREKETLENALTATAREAKSYFGDGSIFIERYIENPRHIEVQILGDKHGNVIHLFDRECSIQRRYQKIIEEAPSPSLSAEIREQICQAAVKIAQKTNYSSAGTIEFLANSKADEFYFLEMNTRIQVEHPVTEMITGIDIVEEQINIALGKKLSFLQEQIKIKGHAIECRIYAENPSENFRPSPGEISVYEPPKTKKKSIRLDSSVDSKVVVESFFDPMISKLITHSSDRKTAINKMYKALNKYHILGIDTNVNFMKELIQTPEFMQNDISTSFCDKHTNSILGNYKRKENGINKNHLALLYLVFKSGKIKQQAVNTWEKIGFLNNNFEVKLSVNETEISVKQLTDKEFLIDKKLYDIENAKISKSSINQSINNISAQAKIYEKENQDFILFDSFVFKIEIKNSLKENAEFDFEELDGGGNNIIKSSMPGKVIKIHVNENDEIKKGDALIIVEAMKMENTINSTIDGKVKSIFVKENEAVGSNKILLEIE